MLKNSFQKFKLEDSKILKNLILSFKLSLIVLVLHLLYYIYLDKHYGDPGLNNKDIIHTWIIVISTIAIPVIYLIKNYIIIIQMKTKKIKIRIIKIIFNTLYFVLFSFLIYLLSCYLAILVYAS